LRRMVPLVQQAASISRHYRSAASRAPVVVGLG
jgi:hypothetical protein